MNTYVLLLRGINVGGKNKVPMQELKACLEGLGYTNVLTYIASGNAFVQTPKSAAQVKHDVEAALPKTFTLDSDIIKILVLTKKQLQAIVDNRPKGFGDHPEMYHSDAIFLMDVSINDAMPIFNPREGVDMVWPGDGVVYSQRVSALRVKSRLSSIIASPLYKSMTIRSWATTLKLLEILKTIDAK